MFGPWTYEFNTHEKELDDILNREFRKALEDWDAFRPVVLFLKPLTDLSKKKKHYQFQAKVPSQITIAIGFMQYDFF